MNNSAQKMSEQKGKISKRGIGPELQTIAELRESLENFDKNDFQNQTFSNDFESSYHEQTSLQGESVDLKYFRDDDSAIKALDLKRIQSSSTFRELSDRGEDQQLKLEFNYIISIL